MTLAVRARAWRAQRRRAILLEASLRSAAAAAAFFGALALIDRFAALPRGARLAGLGAWAAGEAWLLRGALWRPWRALDWDAVFAAAAREWPATRPLLASAWSLRAGPAAPGTSLELRGEHLARADRAADGLPDRPLFAWSPSPGARLLAAAAAAALSLNAAWGDRASAARVLAPWRDAALERWVAVSPGNARLDWGAPAAVSVRTAPGAGGAGVAASGLLLEARGADGAWRALEWTRADAGGAEWRTDALSAPLDYRVRWRDLTTAAYRLEPVPPPRWARAAAVVRGPRGAARFDLGSAGAVRARRGDWVDIEGEAGGPLASASLRLTGLPAAIPLSLRRGVWSGGFPALQDGSLSFELVSSDGRRDPSPPVYALTVAADSPPTVELLSPQEPLAASPQDDIVVAYAARDDSAVTRAALVVAAAGEPERSIALPVPEPPRADVLGDRSWSLAGLRPGTRAEFWIEAWDDATPPQIGRSERGSVEIVDAEADHAGALAAREAADAALERAAIAAEAARDAARSGDLRESAKRTAAVRADWSAAAAALAAWAAKAGADPRGDPGLAEEAERAAAEFARAGEEGVPAAEKALAASDAAAAAREHGALADEARGVQQALREGARAQSLQDFAGQMERARQSSAAVSDEAGKLAARGGQGSVSAAEVERLDKALDEVDRALDALRRELGKLPEISPEEARGDSSELPLDAAQGASADLRRALQSGDLAGAAKAAARLAESLRALSRTLDAAGRRAAEERGRRGGEAAGRVSRAWRDAAEAQTRAVEAARKLDNERLAGLLAEQRGLLAAAAADFDREVSSRAASDAARPAGFDAFVAEAAGLLKSGDAAGAARMMRAAAGALRAAGGAGSGGASAGESARVLDGVASRLEQGPPAPPADAAAAAPAAAAQESALENARRLRAAVRDAARRLGYLSGRAARLVEGAISEEERGGGALRRGDSGEGLKRAEAALTLLQEGGKDADGAASAAAGAASSMGSGGAAGVSVRAAPRGATGADQGHVRMPRADEYLPPRELREELQRSLTEPRPAADDDAIKEYFRRLAR